MKITLVTLSVVFTLLATLLLNTRSVEAWPRYRSGCDNCHDYLSSPYTPPGGGPAWPASLHTVHRSSSYMDAACGLCHRAGDGGNPYLLYSDGAGAAPGIGCLGCHGHTLAGQPVHSGLVRAHEQVGSACSPCPSSPSLR